MGLIRSRPEPEPQLGKTYRDTVTGFEGIATARHEYLNGCVRFMLEAGKDVGGTHELVFDEQRLVEVPAPELEITRRRSGGGRDVPPRTGAQ